MNKIKIFFIVCLLIAVAGIAAWFVYMHFIKTYEVGKDPKLSEITRAYYLSGTQSSDYGYIYDQYSVSTSDSKYYAETDLFDRQKKEQVVTKLEITGKEYEAIISLLEGCTYIRQGTPRKDRMDGYLDESNYFADIRWSHQPDGAWKMSMPSEARQKFAEAVEKAVMTTEVSFTDVWIIRDTPGNRSTTVWGTAMIDAEENGKEYSADIPLSEDDRYLFRMIDREGIYYSANIPCLKSGWKLYLRWETNREVLLDVFDEKGELFVECEVFSAAL